MDPATSACDSDFVSWTGVVPTHAPWASTAASIAQNIVFLTGCSLFV